MGLSGFIPITRLADPKSKEKLEKKIGRKLESYEEIIMLAARLNGELKHFYIDMYNLFKPICYLKGFLYVEISETKEGDLNDAVKMYDTLLKNKDFITLFHLVNKRIRFEKLQEYFFRIPNEQIYDVFCSVYSITENEYSDFIYFFNKVKECRPKIDEKVYGDSIDTQGYLTVYRGEGKYSTSYERAFSWTLDKDVATSFINRRGGDGIIYRAKVHCDDIIAFIDNREEKEILLQAKNLIDVQQIENDFSPDIVVKNC